MRQSGARSSPGDAAPAAVGFFRRGSRWRNGAAVVGALALAALVVAGLPFPRTTASAATVEPTMVPTTVRPLTNLSATVTWNGVAVAQANVAGTAFTIGPGQTASVVFNFTEQNGSDPVTNASLVLRYLDLNLSVETIRTEATCPPGSGPTSPCSGTAELNWTFGSLLVVTEGVYEVDANLLDPNGSLLFHEPFYVDARAPYVLGSAIILFAVVLGVAEVAWVVTVLRARRRRRRYRFR